MTMDDCVVALVEDIADGYVLPNQDLIGRFCIHDITYPNSFTKVEAHTPRLY